MSRKKNIAPRGCSPPRAQTSAAASLASMLTRMTPPRSTLLPTPYSLLPRRRRPAFSLAELLIVITIMIMLMAITLPAVKQVMQDSGIREASRQLNAYFAMAKARALQTGRPCGVMMRCDLPLGGSDPTQPSVGAFPNWTNRIVTQLYLAEVPAPYAGSTTGARGRIMASLSAGAGAGIYEFHPLIWDTSTSKYIVDTSELAILGTLIEDGEQFSVRFENKGPWYVCQRSGSMLLYTGVTTALMNAPVPPSMNIALTSLPGFPYQIVRQPRRIGNPLELTAGTCIDLAYSGIGPTNLPSNSVLFGMYPCTSTGGGTIPPGLFPTTPAKLENLTIMFLPDGGIQRIYLNNYSVPPPTTVHFLIGKPDRINPPLGASTHPSGRNMFDTTTSNVADPLCLWLSVARATGNVNTSQNSPPTTDRANVSSTSMILNPGPNQQVIDPSKPSDQVYYLSLCRRLASNREQARE